MSRRDALVILGLVALTLVAAGVIYSIQHRRQLDRDVDTAISEPLDAVISSANASTNVDTTGPKFDFLANVDGDVTMLTVTVSNPTLNPYKNIRLGGLTLGRIEPREIAALPIKIAELAPGTSQEVVLHYDGLKWLGDEIAIDRIDTGWAQKPLDLSSSWVAVVNSKAASADPNVTVTSTDAKGSSNTKGIPIRLDEQQARLMKIRRDAAWKAKAQRDPFAGEWVWSFEYEPGVVVEANANFVRDGNNVNGTVVFSPDQKPDETKITDAEIDGTKITFKLIDTQDRFVTTYTYTGTSDGDKITGRVQISKRKSTGQHLLSQFAWSAARK